jgi:glycosyltransferase involved in cell wall biosynthesis
MNGNPSVAIVTDTIDDVNGVALGLRRLAASSARAGLPLRLVGAGERGAETVMTDADGIVRVPTILRRALSFYPDMRWGVPWPTELARWIAAARIDVVQCATPGPMGLAALAAARLLRLPVIAQYHTEVATYVARMLGRPRVGAAVDRVVGWFYRQADLCLAPSQTVIDRLRSYGVNDARIRRVPRGIDLALFHPSRRDRSSLARFGLADKPTILYVGRLSREKNLETLLRAHALVRRTHPEAALLVVGAGPISGSIRGDGVVLAGELTGTRLAEVFASADLFAFPSETETFGNVVVEAQASGLPVVVAGKGAAHEHVLRDVTGLVAEGAEDFAAAIVRLLDDPATRARMGHAAHRFAQWFDPDRAARDTFALYRETAEA